MARLAPAFIRSVLASAIRALGLAKGQGDVIERPIRFASDTVVYCSFCIPPVGAAIERPLRPRDAGWGQIARSSGAGLSIGHASCSARFAPADQPQGKPQAGPSKDFGVISCRCMMSSSLLTRAGIPRASDKAPEGGGRNGVEWNAKPYAPLYFILMDWQRNVTQRSKGSS